MSEPISAPIMASDTYRPCEYFLWRACALLWERPVNTLVGILATLAVASPLYVLDYHLGEHNVLGLAVALALGPWLVCALIYGWGRNPRGQRIEMWRIAELGVISAIGWFTVGLVLRFLLGFLPPWEEGSAGARILSNELAYAWKPIASVAIGASLLFLFPAGYPLKLGLHLRGGMSWKRAGELVTIPSQNEHYSIRMLFTYLWTLTCFLAWVPWVCLLIPTLMANLASVMYQEIFQNAE